MYAERGGEAMMLHISSVELFAIAPIPRFYEPPSASAKDTLSNWTPYAVLAHNARLPADGKELGNARHARFSPDTDRRPLRGSRDHGCIPAAAAAGRTGLSACGLGRGAASAPPLARRPARRPAA